MHCLSLAELGAGPALTITRHDNLALIFETPILFDRPLEVSMQGLMMDVPLLLTAIMNHADRNHAKQEIVSVTADNPLHRYTFGDCFARARKLANVFGKLGASADARIATLAWNDYRHMELYFSISCSGRICHTINPRLFAEQLIYIINHAEDEFIFVDIMFVELLEEIAVHCPHIKGCIVLTDAAHMPATSLPNVMCYDTLLAAEPDTYEWPELDENTAAGLWAVLHIRNHREPKRCVV